MKSTSQTNPIIYVILVGLFLFASMFFYARWEKQVTGGGDSWGYYVYLPSLFIHKDIKNLKTSLDIREKNARGSTFLDETGIRRASEAPSAGKNNVIKYTYGVALMHSPSFFACHFIGKISNAFETDGFSRPYIFALYLSTFLYVLIGLFLIAKVLAQSHSSKVVFIVLLILGLGTNLYYFSVYNNVMAHPLLFFLWAHLIFQTDKYYKDHKLWRFLLIAFTVGLITIIRPVEGICILIPLLWNTKDLNGLFFRFIHFRKNLHHLFLGAIAGIAAILPQLFYWKHITGEWVYYSYPGEGFDFSSPEIINGLFGFMNGWLPYTPLMFFALIGLMLMLFKRSANAFLIAILFVVHVYITYSWWNWYYINGFGSRPMVDIYALMAIPLAFFVSKIMSSNSSTKSSWPKALFSIILVFLMGVNIFQTYQHYKGIMWTELGNLAYYRHAFTKLNFNQKMSVALDLNMYQYEDIEDGPIILKQDFEDDGLNNKSEKVKHKGKYSYKITKEAEKDLGKITIPYKTFLPNVSNNKYLKVGMWVYVNKQISTFYEYDSMIMQFNRGERVYKRRYLRLNNKSGGDGDFSLWYGKPNEWNYVEAYFQLATRFREGDEINIWFNHENDRSEVFIDDLELSVAER